MKKFILFSALTNLLIFGNQYGYSQSVGVSGTGAVPNSSALLDVDATGMASPGGVLIPRISLSSTTDITTIASPANSLVVYNTNATMTNGNGVGFYFYNTAYPKWIFITSPTNGPGTSGQVLTSGGAGAGTTWTTISTHAQSHAMTSTSDHTANNWKMFYSNGSGQINELAVGTAGQVLTANGTTSAPTWGAAGSGWSLAGNTLTGTLPTTPTEWFGNANAADLIFKTNNAERMRLLSTGNFGINTTAPSSLLDITKTAIGITQSDAYGLSLVNTTAAATGAANQQYSPAIHWRGNGWKTQATAASQTVDFRTFVFPMEGFSNPTGGLAFQAAANGGAYSTLMNIINDATYGGELAVGDFTNPEAAIEIRKLNAYLYVRSYNDWHSFGQANLTLQTMGGSPTAPTASQANDIIGTIDFRGGFGSSPSGTTVASISCFTPVTFSGSTRGGDLRFYTINTTVAGAAPERMRIDGDGHVGIGQNGPPAAVMLDVKGAGNTSASYGFGVRNSADSWALAVRDDGHVGIGTISPRGPLHVIGGVNAYSYVQGTGSGGTAFGAADVIPIASGNGVNAYGGLGLIPDRWGNASTADAHNILYVAGSQRNNGATSATVAFGNWGYFTNTGGGAGGLANGTDQTNAVKFKIELHDAGAEFTQRLDFISRSASATEFNAITILSSGKVGIGTTGPGYPLTVNGEPAANGYTLFTNYSDIRLKKNITNINNSLDKIMQLRPVQFNYNEEYLNLYNDTSALTHLQKGFIAQEVKEIFPEMVGSKIIKGKEYYDLNLSNLQIYIVKAIQEQQAIIDSLKSVNKDQQKTINLLQTDNSALKTGFQELNAKVISLENLVK